VAFLQFSRQFTQYTGFRRTKPTHTLNNPLTPALATAVAGIKNQVQQNSPITASAITRVRLLRRFFVDPGTIPFLYVHFSLAVSSFRLWLVA